MKLKKYIEPTLTCCPSEPEGHILCSSNRESSCKSNCAKANYSFSITEEDTEDEGFCSVWDI